MEIYKGKIDSKINIEENSFIGKATKIIKNVILEKHGGCPCLYTVPCSKHCTCIEPISSFGCKRCATYGNLEQKKEMAEHLAIAIDTYWKNMK